MRMGLTCVRSTCRGSPSTLLALTPKPVHDDTGDGISLHFSHLDPAPVGLLVAPDLLCIRLCKMVLTSASPECCAAQAPGPMRRTFALLWQRLWPWRRSAGEEEGGRGCRLAIFAPGNRPVGPSWRCVCCPHHVERPSASGRRPY